jgi:hypothetical protein
MMPYVRQKDIYLTICGETNHSLRHYPTYSGATTGTEEDFVLEYVLLENGRRLDCGVCMRV